MRIRLSLACLLTLLALAAPAQALETGVVHTQRQSKPLGQTAQEVGAGWVRLWASWEEMQPARGAWHGGALNYAAQNVADAKARGLKVLMVVQRSPAWASGGRGGTAPPTDPADFADAMAGLAARLPGVDAWELWNEEDEPQFWAGGADPAHYAAMVRAAYPAIKAVQPQDVVVTGATTGNNMDFIAELYKHGIKGSFDAVGVHTDTACLVDGPDRHYRDELGRIGRYSFTGYREVHAVMAANGDAAKPIWMTELGWNTQSTAPNSCNTGTWAGTKPLGVTEAQQADFLTQAYRCLAADPIVGAAFWFGMQDIPGAEYAAGYGLFRADGTAKPSAAAFAALAGGISPVRCGGVMDTTGPRIKIAKPTAGAQFKGMFAIDARAIEPAGGVGVQKIEIYADGKFSRSYGNGRALMRAFWPSAEWKNGSTHRITFKAWDEADNTTSKTIRVTKVRKLRKIRTAGAVAVAALDPATVKVTGSVAAKRRAHAAMQLPGRVFVTFQRQVAPGQWLTVHRVARKARRPVDVTQAVVPGSWRVFLDYRGRGQFVRSRSAPVAFAVA